MMSLSNGHLTNTLARGGIAAWLIVFMPVFAIFVATATFNLDRLNPDPIAAALSAESVAHDFDLTVENAHGNKWITTGTGRPLSDRQPGVIFFGVPFYLLSPDNGFSMVPAAVAGAFSAAAAVATLFLLFQGLVSTRTALVAALIVAFGTSTWTVSAESLWTHGPDQLFLALAMLAVTRRSWLLSGVALAGAILTRTHLAVVALVLGLFLAWRRRSLRPAVLIGIPSLLGVAGVLLYTHHAFGVWDISAGYSTRESYPTSQLLGQTQGIPFALNLVGLLFSLQRGIFIISPFLLLLLPGLRAALRTAPDWVKASAAGGVLYMAVQLRINFYAGGGRFWGYRLALETVTLASPLLLLCYREWTAKTSLRRRLFGALVIVATGYQVIGALLYTNPPASFENPWNENYLVLGTSKYPAMITHGPHQELVLAVIAITLGLAAATLAGKLRIRESSGSPTAA